MKVVREDRTFKMLMAGASFLVALITYMMTVAPTVSFWDCGEFVAAAHTLGIPHPPGTPFFNIIARAVIIALGFVPEVALRVNYISVVTSALTVFFCFLIAFDVINSLMTDSKFEKGIRRFISSVSGFTAAFLVTFSDTFWFSAVEAEVYGLAMLFVFGITYLSLLWARNHDNSFGNRLLILIIYFCYLGVGVHMYSLITLPAIFIFALFVRKDFRDSKAWPVWLSGFLLYSIVYSMDNFISVTIWTAIILGVLSLVVKNQNTPYFKLSFWFAVMAIVGYSTHAYIPIRSALNPIIDENNPEIANVFDSKEWEPFNRFIMRKQYGSEGMISRAMTRRGSAAHQVLTFPHMGYGGYQIAQYLPWKVGFVNFTSSGKYDITPQDNAPLTRGGMEFSTQMAMFQDNMFGPFILFLMFNGLIFIICRAIYRENKGLGIYIGLMMAIISFGLIFYMNFGDGTRPDSMAIKYWEQAGKPAGGPQIDHLEVRERDYFYTPAYVFMGVIYGIGAGVLLLALYRKKSINIIKPTGIAIASLAFAVPLFSNYKEHDRSGLYVPWDYAWNLIQSTHPNSVIFTNGDNDTFPLWFIQEVENVRKDTRVINLSLANTPWYINQMLTQEPKIRLNMLGQNLKQLERGIDIKSFKAMSDKMMTKLNVSLPQQEALVQSLSNPANKDSLSQLHGPKFNDMLKKNIIKLNLMTNDWQAFTAFEKWVQKYRPSYIKLQDLVVLDVMRSNPEKPIHFASTVGKNNYMGFENFMALEGMVYTLNRFSKKAPKDFNLEKTLALVDSTYQFRGINDGTYINDETMRLLSNYNSIFIRIALDAREEIAKAQYMSQQMQGAAKPEFLTKKIESKLAEGISYLEKGISLFPKEWRLYVVGADLYSIAEDFDAATKQIEKGISAVEAWDVPILERKKQEIEGAALQAKARKEAALKAMATAVPTPAVETK